MTSRTMIAIGLGMAMLVMPGGGVAQDGARDLAAAFGAREAIQQASLSPDGTKVAFVESLAGQGSAVLIVDLAQATPKPTAILQVDGKPERLSGCRWASDTRLLCSIYGITRLDGQIAYASRMVAINSDGTGQKLLAMPRGAGAALGVSLFGGSVIDWQPGKEGHVLVVRSYVPERTTGTNLAQTREGLGVDMIDTVTMRAAPVERADAAASEYITDGAGTVRIIGRQASESQSGYVRDERRYAYRKTGERGWLPLSTVLADGVAFDPHGVDPTQNVAYGLKRVDGRLAAYKVALDGSLREEPVFAHPQVDVSGFLRIGRRGRIVGVSYVTDARESTYFDPALAALRKSLARALPDTPLIQFVDSSEDEQKMLLWAGADNDPGSYYLFDRRAKQLSPLLPDRPMLEGIALATMKAVRYPAADGTAIPGYLTLPPGRESAKGLPALVMPHGGPGSRDEWGFDWLAQYFASKGYAVLQPNFRGSTGYGDAWFRKNGFQSWQVAIGDVNYGGRWLVQQGIADPRRMGIFGWSYGGYAALQSGVAEPGLFKAIVAVAPVTDLDRLREARRGWSDYKLVSAYVGTGPHVASGSPARHAGRIAAPVLMFHGDLDRNVGVDQARLMQARLEQAGRKSELVVYPGLDHYLEDGAVRTQMLRQADAFLKGAMGG